MKEQLRITFKNPGIWDDFILAVFFAGPDGYSHTRFYGPGDIPEEHAAALECVVGGLVGLCEPWRARWARAQVERVAAVSPEEEGCSCVEAVVLTVGAVNESAGYRVFTPDDYAEFVILDEGARKFFKYFTEQ